MGELPPLSWTRQPLYVHEAEANGLSSVILPRDARGKHSLIYFPSLFAIPLCIWYMGSGMSGLNQSHSVAVVERRHPQEIAE